MSLSNLARQYGRQKASASGQQKVFNIVEFAEQTWGLHMRLFPVQRFILKLYYMIPLETVEKTIRIPKSWRQENFYDFTEQEYLEHLFNEGRCNIKAQDHMRRELILPVGRRSGKCVLGDSLVLTDKGVFRIEELGDPEGPETQPLDIGVVQEAGKKSRSAYFYNGGVKDTFTFTTKGGYQLGGTGNHRIKVLDSDGTVQWKYCDQIRVGDVAAINRSTDLWSREPVDLTEFHNSEGRKSLDFPKTLTEDWSLLLGYLVGDGSWNPRDMVAVTVEHSETWEDLKDLYTRLFGDFRVLMDKRRDNTGRIAFHSVGIRKFLHDLGWRWDLTRDTKHIPWSILRSPKPVVAAFLRGLFEADGGVEAGGKVVSFSTASERLAQEVQTLLLNFGIVSRTHSKVVKGKTYFILTVRGLRSRKTFAKEIGFRSQKKMVPLVSNFGSREGGNTESVPHQKNWVSALLDSVPANNLREGTTGQFVSTGWNRSLLREAMGNTCKPGSSENITYPRIERVLQVAHDLGADPTVCAHFEHLLGLDYCFEEITALEKGAAPVYDLNVPEGHSFVANGFTNHNTALSAIISAYEVYRLLAKSHPQSYYGLPDGNNIQLISVATDKDQAGLLFNETQSHFQKCEYFSPYMANFTQSYVNFQTPFDVQKYGSYGDNERARRSLKVTFRSCIAKGLRGAGNIVIILDEVAHFTDGGQSGAETVYKAVVPSKSAFSPKDPNDSHKPLGPSEGRVILISSPLNKAGLFYEMYNLAKGGGEGSKNLLMIQAPTWEVNPTVPASEFAVEYSKDVPTFMTEYGAEFSDRVRGWIEREADLQACIDPDHRPRTRAVARIPHFVGLDLGLTKDATTVVISHPAGNGTIDLDYHESWAAGRPWAELNPHLERPIHPYALELESVDKIDMESIAEWLELLSRRFIFEKGLIDQWEGIALEQHLEKKGLSQFKREKFSRELTSRMYQSFKMLMYDERLRLYDFPLPESGQGRDPGASSLHSPHIQELLELEATRLSKHIVTVQAPQLDGKHDDFADALIRSIWLSTERMINQKVVHSNRRASVDPKALGVGSLVPRGGYGGRGVRLSVRGRALRTSQRKKKW